MATVHLARQVGAAGFARIVAIKRLHERYARDPDFVAMFLDEARIVARIRHPNVVQTIDVGVFVTSSASTVTASDDGGRASPGTSSATCRGTASAAPMPGMTCPEGMAMVPGGRFFMGSDENLPAERPSHKVTLPPCCMDRFEVTTEAYRACSERGDCKRAGLTNSGTV